ncbi:MAG: sulfurtransferase [Burkholderiaceae bacterium]|nr:sulfurtransferase [Burkholderiaceae bacterium]
MDHPGPVVDADWLTRHIEHPAVRIVDASFHLPDTGRDAAAEFVDAHIPGAVFFDFNRVADPANSLPRRFPPADVFAREVGRLGIDNDTHVVAYDTPGLYSAARVWWLFRQHGYDRVSILDGGFKLWQAEGRPVASGEASAEPRMFKPGEMRDLFADQAHVMGIVEGRDEQLLDARTPGRFAGTEKDRYPGARGGNIPSSLNLYWAELLDPQTRRLLPVDEIRARLTRAGITWDRPVTATCGSGLTACILALGLHLAGKDDWRVYDGSWEEWGGRHELPIRSGT